MLRVQITGPRSTLWQAAYARQLIPITNLDSRQTTEYRGLFGRIQTPKGPLPWQMSSTLFVLLPAACAHGCWRRLTGPRSSRLLLWSSIAFAGLALNNLALWIDKLVLPQIDLSVVRASHRNGSHADLALRLDLGGGMMGNLVSVFSGATAMAGIVAALFFLKFWRRTKDSFFLLFAAAFAIDALGRFVLGRRPAFRHYGADLFSSQARHVRPDCSCYCKKKNSPQG